MIITQLKKIGRGDRYSLYVDEQFIVALEAEIIVKNKLKIGQEVDFDYLEKLKLENGNYASFDKALSYLERGMKTEKGIREYLSKKGYLKESIDKTIEKLQSYGYINDEVYAENYIKTYSGVKGIKKLKYELILKGVEKNIIDKKVEELFDEEEEFKNCLNICKKYLKNKNIDSKTYQKLSNHLASKGFSYGIITRAVKECLKGGCVESWD